MTASVHQNELLLFSIIVQLIIMIGVARIFNTIFRKLHQPGVIGEILAGLLLGPSLFGHLFPDVSIAIFGEKSAQPIIILSQIGLIFLMFQIGSDFEFSKITNPKNRNATIFTILFSIFVPFTLGLIAGYYSHPYFAPNVHFVSYCLFIGVAMAITAVPIMGRILKQYNLVKTDMGLISISSAAINDVVGWLLLAGISAYAASELSGTQLTLQIIGLALLLPFSKYILSPIAKKLVGDFDENSTSIDGNRLAIIIIMIFALGLYTYKLGIFAIFGGFVCGLVFHQYPHFVRVWNNQVGQFVMVFFLPIFFTFTGLRTNVLGLDTGIEWLWLFIILACSVLGKVIPVYFVGRSNGFDKPRSLIMAYLMNTRALMELIVLNIGYDMGILPQNVFTMLTIMAIATTLMTGPLLKVQLKKIGHEFDPKLEA